MGKTWTGSHPAPVLLLARELNLGGTERQLVEIARSLDRMRFSPRVGVFRSGGMRCEELRRCGIPLVEFPVRSFRKPSLLVGAWKLASYVRKEGVALVHAFDPPMIAFGVPVARLAGAPRVLSSLRGSRGLTPPAMRRWLRHTDRWADGVVVNCLAMRREIEAEGVQAANVHLCYNGLDRTIFHPRPQDEPPGGVPVIGTVCALRPEKDLGTLLEAFARLRAAGYKARLLIAGDGPSRAELAERSRTLGLDAVCQFAGSVQNVAPVLRQIDVFVLPSLSEAFSNSLMEAMACGCAVVATGVGGNPELVTEGQTGLLFPPGNVEALTEKLVHLLTDRQLCRRLTDAASARMRDEFSLEASAGRMGAIYEEVLSAALQ